MPRPLIVAVPLVAALLALPACGKKNKPTASDMPPPEGGIGAPGMPGTPGMPGMPGNPNAGQPGDGSLPPRPQPPGLTSDVRTRQQGQGNLKQIGLALHFAADANRTIPVGIADRSGKVGLSWRVAILPYLEQENLYRQFKLDEPWDSENNKKLIRMMPKVFAAPGGDANGYTYYRSFSGPDTAMPPPARPAQPGQVVGGVGLFAIPDGTSNTLLVVEAAEPVIWTKPDELPFTRGQAPPKVGGGVFRDGFNVVMCDGSTRFLKMSISPTDLANAINRQDGMIVNLDN
ncbi:MAG TPA: DUF1559 domain-containing protein [Gemmata sp.]|nr:DUF1559 domain-containing protein [Gemmata sp.]